MSATPPSVIGVAGVPEVAAALREIGHTVITGNTFREAAIAIAAHQKHSPIPVVVEAVNEPGFTPWVLNQHSKYLDVILLPTSADADLGGALAGVPQLPLPATVNDLLVALGASPALADAGEVRISGPAAAHAPAQDVAPALAPVPTAGPVDDFAALMAQAGAGSDQTGGASREPAAEAPVEVSDPFASTPAVSDPFEEMLASATAPAVHVHEDGPAPHSQPDEPATPVELGVANPSTPAIPTVVDPYDASGITGEAPTADDFLSSIALIAAADEVPAAAAPTGTPVEPVTIPAVVEPLMAEPAVIPTVIEPLTPAPAEPMAQPEPLPVPAVIPAVAEPVVPAPLPVPQVIPQVAEPLPQPVVHAAPAQVVPAPAPDQSSEFIRQVLARREVRPVTAPHDQVPLWQQTPAFAAAPADAGGFFSVPGISAGGCQVIISLAGKGGAGKTTQSLMYAQTAGAAGLRVLLIDANRDQGDIGTSLRIEKVGFPTVLHSIQGLPGDAIISKDQINAARPASAKDITFDVVLAPPREFAGPRYASAQVYAKLLAYAKSRYDIVVIDTQIVEAQKSDLHTGFIIPELRSGAWSAGIALYDYSAIRNAFAVFDELAALGVTPQRTLVVATRWPESETDHERFVSQFGQYGTFVGFVGDDPNVNAQKSVGNLLIESPAVSPVVRTLLHRVTNHAAFAPVEETGRRRRGKAATAPAKNERRGLFGGRR